MTGVFTRTGDAPGGKPSSSSGASSHSSGRSSSGASSQSAVGSWQLSGGWDGEKSYTRYQMLDSFGYDYHLDLYENGTAIMRIMDTSPGGGTEQEVGDWSQNGNRLVVTIEEQDIEGRLENGVMILDDLETRIYFVRD